VRAIPRGETILRTTGSRAPERWRFSVPNRTGRSALTTSLFEGISSTMNLSLGGTNAPRLEALFRAKVRAL
jgi:hypothetical protein